MKKFHLRERAFCVLLAACAWLALGFAFAHHELWRDEAQAWLLSRAAPSYWSLFSGEARTYEGHPFAWFWLLRAASKLSPSYLSLQGIALVIAAANAALLAGLPGLPRWARTLMVFSYVTFFEFGVIARNYGLAVLGLALALRLSRWCSRWRPAAVALSCGLAANAALLSVPAASLIVALTCAEPLIRAWRGRRARRATSFVPEIGASAGFLMLVWFAVATSRLPADSVAQLGNFPRLGPASFRALGEHLLNALAPIPSLAAGYHWWNTNILLPLHVGSPAMSAARTPVPALLGFAWLAVWVFALQRRRLLALGLLLSVLGVAITTIRLPYWTSRYDGQISLCLIVAVALAAARQPGLFRKGWVAALTAFTFGSSAMGTVAAVALDHAYDFSQSKAAAQAIGQLGLTNAPLVGFEYYKMSPLAAYLGRELWSPEHGRDLSYGIWTTRIHDAGYSSLNRAVTRRGVCHAALTARSAEGAYVVCSERLVPGVLARDVILVRELSSSDTEKYFIYRVAPVASSTALWLYCNERQ